MNIVKAIYDGNISAGRTGFFSRIESVLGPYEPILPRGVRTSALTQWTYDYFTSAQSELGQGLRFDVN